MKRPLAYITAGWLGGDSENAEQAARYCRAVYEAGFSPICPIINSICIGMTMGGAVLIAQYKGADDKRDRRSLFKCWPCSRWYLLCL